MCVTINPQILKLDGTPSAASFGPLSTNAICTSSSYRLLSMLHAAGENLRGVCDFRGAMGCLLDTKMVKVKKEKKVRVAYSPKIKLLYIAPHVFVC